MTGKTPVENMMPSPPTPLPQAGEGSRKTTPLPQAGEGSSGSGNSQQPCGAVLVCGGGVAGIQASLDLSAAGFRVFLVEESATIGGGMARLDKTFPTGDCATCIISPKLVECMRDYNIDVLTMADVTALEGEAGHFVAEVRKRPRGVDATKCTGCGDCWTICPVRNTAERPPPFRPSEPLDEAGAARLNAILARHEGELGAIMPVLHEINHAYGYLPRLMLEHVAHLWGLRLAEILRVASFYDRFHLEPLGRHVVEVCSGTSCHSRRSKALLKRVEELIGVRAGQTDPAGRFTLRTVRCLGLCALSPAMKIDGQSFGRVGLDRVPEILEQFA
jgi:NADH:ubiquinone oxidoreductase subunit E/NAD-dependent dihydropyrimidine dehydrogenase PreA subunit